jgi:hypothetical protein
MAANPVTVYRGAASVVAVGGQPVVAVYADALGAVITNPLFAADQGLSQAEYLYVDLVNPAALQETITTSQLAPGQSFVVPANTTENVTVNAASSGHRFSVVVFQPSVPPQPPTPGPFAPTGPLTVLFYNGQIASYLYQEYNDDDDLQAFVDSYNAIAQVYLDWFNTINLPVYTGDQIMGALLDWVGQGLYGVIRPALSSGQNTDIGPLNTWMFNQIPLDDRIIVSPGDVVATSDDIYKRIITWNYYKGDGRTFDVRWLKRRIMRFLEGVNGTAPLINNTWQVSVSFGIGNEVSIRLLTVERIITSGAIYGTFMFNSMEFNEWETEIDFDYPPLPNAAILVEALQSGALQLPFQYDFSVTA